VSETQVLGREAGPSGEVVLRRRGVGEDAVVELIVNGVFAMDSTDPSSERALGELPLPTAGARVLLGGLGLGYTALAVLDRAPARLDVVELEPALLRWARAHLTAPLGRVADDPRVRLHAADVAEVIARPDAGPWDAILLDVDNGPDFLIHEHNAGLYGSAGLRGAHDRLTPGGILAIWCQGPAPELLDRLRAIDPDAGEQQHRHRRGRREWSYVIYTVRHP
jgi:spermidine synthase